MIVWRKSFLKHDTCLVDLSQKDLYTFGYLYKIIHISEYREIREEDK